MGARAAIRRYKQAHQIPWREVAQRLGISPNYARRLGCGLSPRTSPELAKRIEKRSGGEIRADELVF